MKKLLLAVIFSIMIPGLVLGQQMINNFDVASPDTNYWAYFANHGGQHYQTSGNAVSDYGWITISHVADPVEEGIGALHLTYSAQNIESWGGYTKLEHWNPDSTAVYDWSNYDSVAFWYNNVTAQALKGRVHLRFNLHDVSNSTNGNDTYDVTQTEYYYSFHYILDNEPGWHKIQLPLKDDRNAWAGEAFNRTGWSGVSGNDVLDTDKIKGFSFEFSINGAGEGDYSQGAIVLDHLTLVGRSRTDFIFFNGKSTPSNFGAPWSWGQSSFGFEEGAGELAGTNAMKWVQGNEWGNGWTGAGFNINPPYNMSYEWPMDSLKFNMKTDEGVGPIRIQFEDGSAKIGSVFQPITDNNWHDYTLKLSDFVHQDGTSGFNPGNVAVLGIMAEGSGIAGKTIYISYMWTGNPVIDVVAPPPPPEIHAIPAEYYNLVIWSDVNGETGETYTVYGSVNPITDLADPSVEMIQPKVLEGTQTAVHYLSYPLKDKELTYNYAITCTDQTGNVSATFTASTSAVTNSAKGVATISLNPPVYFVADGDLSEWYFTDIKPFEFAATESHWSIGTFDDDNDLSATTYVAVDDNYLYFAADVIDNVYSYDPTGNFWEDDMIEFYIGLYNETKQHRGYKRDAEPDYKFMFIADRVDQDGAGVVNLMQLEDANYEFVNFGASDWAVEVRLPLDSILVAGYASDARFHPLNGMKIRMDICFHDSDSPNVRDGVISYSEIASDNSYVGAENWNFTWIGDTDKVATSVKQIETMVAKTYDLSQNFPNPFNPKTTIEFALAEPGKVKLEIYNTLGQKVKTVVDEYRIAGNHEVSIDASDLTSGIYFYKLQSANFTTTRKMVLMK